MALRLDSLTRRLPRNFSIFHLSSPSPFLDQVLDALIEQGVFRCKKNKLGAKMAASKGVFNWRNYEHVDQARCARNTLAHEAKLVSKGQALELIQAIRDELKGWRILEE
jgi:hypothetical protein